MSVRLEMLQVARLAPRLLGDSTELVQNFLRRSQNSDGGFKDRSGVSDLYYTVFGIEALRAIRAEVPVKPLVSYLAGFGSGSDLSFVHACCLARAWASVSEEHRGVAPDLSKLPANLERYRTAEGGYNVISSAAHGSVYGAFLALGAYQDLHQTLPNIADVLRSIEELRTPDGAWANDPGMKIGSTNATAAAMTLLRNLSRAAPEAAGEWLLARAHPEGGFRAAPDAPIPDLLSTATALHALSGMQIPIGDKLKESSLDFVDTLWTSEGGFYGHWAERELDCEYTYYGLLALGHLSL